MQFNSQDVNEAYLYCLAIAINKIQFNFSKTLTQKLQIGVERSYFVAYKAVESQKCCTTAVNMILPYAQKIVSKVCEENQMKKFSLSTKL